MSVKLLTNAEKLERKVKSLGVIEGLASCVTLVIDDGEICLEVPYVGNLCISLPGFPNGTLAKACIELSFPACAKVTVTVLGNVVFERRIWNLHLADPSALPKPIRLSGLG